MTDKSDKLDGSIKPDRIHRFVNSEEDDKYLVIIPANPSTPEKTDQPSSKEKK